MLKFLAKLIQISKQQKLGKEWKQLLIKDINDAVCDATKYHDSIQVRLILFKKSGTSFLLQLKSFEEFCCKISSYKIFILHQLQMKRNSCFYAFNYVFAQGTIHCVNRLITCTCNSNKFTDH